MEPETKQGFTVYIDESGILRLDLSPGFAPSSDEVKAITDSLQKISGDQYYPILFDARNLKKVTFRDFILGDRNAQGISKATAILVGSPFSRLIGSFILNFTAETNPVKMFSNLEEAKKWLLEF